MCCLFGFYNYSGKSIGKLSKLTNSLAVQATVRGTDASGIAYNDNGKLIIHKYKLYVYASTDEILYKALIETKLFDEIKQGRFEEIQMEMGDILNILPDGTMVYTCFALIMGAAMVRLSDALIKKIKGMRNLFI